jgi:hypothetical protein
MKLRHLIAAAFVAGAAIAAPAQAGVLGAADLTITSLGIINLATGTVVAPGTISIIKDTRTGNATADYNGVAGTGAGNGNITSTSAGATVDVKYRCAGTCSGLPLGENDFTTHLSTPSGNFAFSDMFLGGSAIGASGANGMTRADASVNSATNTGGANSTILNGATAVTNFTAGSTMTLAFGMTYDAFVKAFIDPLTPMYQSGVASGKISWSLALRDLTTATDIFSWTPEALNKGFTIGDAADNVTYASIGALLSSPILVTGGHNYSLTINQASNSLASLVPEPGSVMLVGLGLVALGASVRRRVRR